MKNRLPTLRWAAGGLLLIGLVSRVFGVLREVLLANYFGISEELDAVFLGLGVPMALTLGIGGGLSRVVVPLAAPLGRTRFAGFCRGVATRLFGFLGGFSILLAITAPLWVNLLVVGEHAPPWRTLALAGGLGSFTILFGGIAGFYKGLANARGRHVSGSLNVLFYNVIVCMAILMFHRTVGALSVLLGILLAEALQIAILWLAIEPELRGARPRQSTRDWHTVRAVIWPAMIVGILQGINLSIDRIFATLLEPGAIAALAYGDKLVNIPVSLIGTALATPLFTRLSQYARSGRDGAFSSTLLLGMRLLLIVGTPLGFLLAATAPATISLLLERGAFDQDGVRLTSLAMAGYSIGVPFQIMFMLMFSACLSRGKHWAAVWIMVATAILNAVLDYVLVRVAGLAGIALATSIVAFTRVLLLILVVESSLLGRTSLWRSGAIAYFSGIVLVALVALLEAGTGLVTSRNRFAQVAAVGISTCLLAAISCAMWKPVLAGEWSSLGKLRRVVARHAAPAEGQP